jgi:hypothetical protein
MRRLLPLLIVAGIAGCGGQGTGQLVGLPASEAICRAAKDGLAYRIDSGPVVKSSPEIACRPVDGPEPKIVRAQQRSHVMVLRATCDPTVGCL